MDLSVLKHSDVQVLRLRGKLTLGQPVDAFRHAFEQAVENGVTHFILNFAEVPIVDSSGIGALVRCHVSLRGRGGSIKLVQPQSYTVKILNIVGLLELFQIYETEEEAAASYER
ncbi:MAG: STAS domain-containing protein [Terriglobales bacterium]